MWLCSYSARVLWTPLVDRDRIARFHDPAVGIRAHVYEIPLAQTANQRSLADLRGRHTLLVVAHRLDTIASADQILMLSAEGALAERGTPGELLERGGLYAHYWHDRIDAAEWTLGQQARVGSPLSASDPPCHRDGAGANPTPDADPARRVPGTPGRASPRA